LPDAKSTDPTRPQQPLAFGFGRAALLNMSNDRLWRASTNHSEGPVDMG
jgi:hypothetical protein